VFVSGGGGVGRKDDARLIVLVGGGFGFWSVVLDGFRADGNCTDENGTKCKVQLLLQLQQLLIAAAAAGEDTPHG